MSATRPLKGIIANFLDTYLSRYSEHEGYWLFGFLVGQLATLHVDLLHPPTDERAAFQRAIDLAVRRFREQLLKAGIDLDVVRSAELTLARQEHARPVDVNESMAVGSEILAIIRVESIRGRQFETQRRVLVAPHNAAVEFKSARTPEGTS
jgi:hypothetical protein